MSNQPQQSRWKKIGVKTKALFGELRKVTYPSAKQVIKQTSVVLAVVIFFLIVLMAQDQILGQLFRLLVGSNQFFQPQTIFLTEYPIFSTMA